MTTLYNEFEGSGEFAKKVMALLGIRGKIKSAVQHDRTGKALTNKTKCVKIEVAPERRGVESLEFDRLIRTGFSFKTGDHLKDELKLTDIQLAEALGLSPKTLQRKRKTHERLSRVESDILYRTARIFALAALVIEDEGLAKEWMHKSQHGLGGRVPFEMIQTEAGVREVEDLLLRIEYGVYS